MKKLTLEELLTDEFVEFQLDTSNLTPLQLRRYNKLHGEGLSRHQIAQEENVNVRAVSVSFKKIVQKNNLESYHKQE